MRATLVTVLSYLEVMQRIIFKIDNYCALVAISDELLTSEEQ